MGGQLVLVVDSELGGREQLSEQACVLSQLLCSAASMNGIYGGV